VDGELAPGVYGGEKGLEAWLSFHGVDSIEEIGRDLQLELFAAVSCERSWVALAGAQ
jgi:hypothetical protein